MKQNAQKQIVIIGCGNVAWHLAKVLISLKSFKVSVYNHRQNQLLDKFKKELKCPVGIGLGKIPGDADYYFICVSDKAISKVAAKLRIRNPNAILMHTSGSAELSDLGEGLYAKAVFYPLQSFSARAEVNWKEIPVLLECTDQNVFQKIKGLADLISEKVLKVSFSERLKLHLAAVLVNNFTNALYVSAADLLKNKKSGFSLELLHPMINQTTEKIFTMDPRAAQTGPAKRGDKTVMEKHLDLINDNSDLKKLYKQLSKLIKKQQR
ncbi:MAG: DUF2520 domain-containing protein [Bacteroidia bacterium]|nr:DUF2520 domain-containing protein [Bacteroidia bacterium]